MQTHFVLTPLLLATLIFFTAPVLQQRILPDAPQEVRHPRSFSISGHVMDKITKGMDSSEVFRIYAGVHVRRDSEWMPTGERVTYAVELAPDVQMTFELDSGKVRLAYTSSPAFKTGLGIGIGTTFGKIRKTLLSFQVLPGEEMGPPYVILPEGISFEMSQTAKWRNKNESNPNYAASVGDDATVVSILVW